jgi:hypothetical protein
MARYQPLYQQAGSYPATQDRQLVSTIFPAGGVTGGVASIVASSMTVSLAPGTAVVPLQAGQGAALCRWDAAEVVTIGAAPASGQTRIDLVCAQVRDNALDSGGNNDFVMIVVPGTAAASNPATPATPTNALALWSVTVIGASANLAGATLTDRRRQMNPRDTVNAKWWRNGAFTVGTAANPITMDTMAYDPLGLYVPAQNGFVVPLTGLYLVGFAFSVVPGAGSGQFAAASISVAGTTAAQNGVHQSMGFGFGPNLTAVVQANAGQVVVGVASVAPSGMNGQPGIASTYLTIDYLGTG